MHPRVLDLAFRVKPTVVCIPLEGNLVFHPRGGGLVCIPGFQALRFEFPGVVIQFVAYEVVLVKVTGVGLGSTTPLP